MGPVRPADCFGGRLQKVLVAVRGADLQECVLSCKWQLFFTILRLTQKAPVCNTFSVCNTFFIKISEDIVLQESTHFKSGEQVMKKYLMILFTAVALFLSACNGGKVETQEVQPTGPRFSVQIELECVENLLFSKYDIDVYVDDNNVDKLDHGATRTYPLELEEGSHTLRVTKENSKSVDGTIDFEVSDNIFLKYKLTCTSNQVKIEAIEDNEAIEDHTATEDSDIDANNSEITVRTVSGFDQSTNQTISFYGFNFSFPAYYDVKSEDSTETRIEFYPEEETYYSSLTFSVQDVNSTTEIFRQKRSALAEDIQKSLTENYDTKDFESTNKTIAGLPGLSVSLKLVDAENPSILSASYVLNAEGTKLICIQQVYDEKDTSNYDYVGDYKKILQYANIDYSYNEQTNTEKLDESDVQTGKSVSYSTNDFETAKKGNSGVFAYRSTGGTYYNYYIIDFDEGYVYWFSDGNGDTTCDRLKIDSGDLNNGLIITYHDGDYSWSEGLHFKWKNQPDTLIWQNSSGFEVKFITTNLNDALKIRNEKTIKDY